MSLWLRWSRRLLVILLAASGAGLAAEPTAPTVVMLSWDGLRHDYPDLHPGEAQLPALARIAAEGVRARRLTAVFPANTFPGHVSLATGTYPDRHGIPDNVFFDREKGTYRYSGDANWLEAEQKFKCPCHGSGFYKDGINFEGPAPRPLERYAIRVAEDGQLEVDKSRTFQQELGQWQDPDCYVKG